jgi:hypothetical protein
MVRVSLFLLMVGQFLSGCYQDPAPAVSQSEKKLETQITAIKSQLDNVQKSVTLLEFKLNSEKSKFESAILDTSSKTYRRVDTTSGFFLVSLQDVMPYADGYRLTLHVGNPSSATYSGFSINAKWGKSLETTDYSEWEKSQHEKSVSYTEELLPSSWNTVYLVLAPAQREELGYIEVSLTTDVVELTMR